MSWRNAHYWLRGYSDAKLGKPCSPTGPTYESGYAAGGHG